MPQPVLVLVVLLSFYALVLHVPLFFNGLFPLFGIWLSGLPGFGIVSILIWSLVLVAWGVWRQQVWAWWAAVIYFGALFVSSVVTLVPSSLSDIVSPLHLPSTEMEMLAGVPLQGIHLAPFVGIPLGVTLVAVAVSGRSLSRERALALPDDDRYKHNGRTGVLQIR